MCSISSLLKSQTTKTRFVFSHQGVSCVILSLLLFAQSSITAPPPTINEQVNERSPQLNKESKFQAKAAEASISNITYLKTDPIDLHGNVGDIAKFVVFLTHPIDVDVRITFKCNGDNGKCATFDGTSLSPITLTPINPRVTVNFTILTAGHDEIVLQVDQNQHALDVINTDDYGFVRIRAGRSTFLAVLGTVFGWIYFLAWSISFWPQNISNFKRKSVVGLNFDYTILHFTGFLFYSIFNITLFFSSKVQDLYEDKFPRSEIPVELNDVVYSIHAAAATSITWCQCMIYESGDQRLSIYGKIFQGIAWTVGGILMVLSLFSVVTWLDFIYYFSYVKLVVTGIKYLPQMIFNFRRKSTAGWSIYMIYLDITGGSMSMLQMLFIAYNYNDWKTLLGNLPKLGLAIASMFYDVIFLLQEFVFFPHSNNASIGSQPSLSRRSTKYAGDSQDQLCSTNMSISSLESSISSKSSNGALGFTVKPEATKGEAFVDGGHKEAKIGTTVGNKTVDLSSNLDAVIIKRKPNN